MARVQFALEKKKTYAINSDLICRQITGFSSIMCHYYTKDNIKNDVKSENNLRINGLDLLYHISHGVSKNSKTIKKTEKERLV